MHKYENCMYRRICCLGAPTARECGSWTPPRTAGRLQRLKHKVKLLFTKNKECSARCLWCCYSDVCYYDLYDK